MIEKLKTINPYDETEIDMDANSVCGLVYENTPLVQKINELVNAVNKILAVQEQYATIYNEDIVPMLTPQNETTAENVLEDTESGQVDVLKWVCGEECQWIGCLCELWSGNSKNHRYGILKGIAKNTYKGHKTIHKYQALSMSFEHCEPVKPDDSIIYKGE